MSEKEQVLDTVIVGGGASGMSAAWTMRDRNFLLLDAADKLGGRIASEPRGDYWMNLGAHLFPGAGSTIASVIRELGLETIEIPGSKTGLFFVDKVRVREWIEAYPITLPLTLRERVAFVTIGIRLLSLVKKWQRVAKAQRGESECSRRTRLAGHEANRSFRDVLGRPPARVNDLFETAARRASCEINEQSAAVGAALFGSHWSGKQDVNALNLLGGSGQFPAAVERQLRDKIRLNTRVLEIRQAEEGVRVEYEGSNGRGSLLARHVIVAVPAPLARSLVHNIPEELDKALAAVRYGSFLVMSMITDEEGPMPWDEVYALTTPGMAFSMFFNHASPLRVGSRRHGGSLMCYAGGDPARRVMDLADEEIERLFRRDLARLYPELDRVIAETKIQRWRIGGQYRGPNDASFGELFDHAEDTSATIHFAGDYFEPLGTVDGAATSGASAARLVITALDKQSTAGAPLGSRRAGPSGRPAPDQYGSQL